MKNLPELTTLCKKDIQLISTKYATMFSSESLMLNRLVSRNHTLHSLLMQVKCYIDKVVAKNSWWIFKSGHSCLTREVIKTVKYYSQEERILGLENTIKQLNISANTLQDIHEQEKRALIRSYKRLIAELQKKNAGLVKQLSDLMELEGQKTERNNSSKTYIPNLIAITDTSQEHALSI